jgi:hypothetical protein
LIQVALKSFFIRPPTSIAIAEARDASTEEVLRQVVHADAEDRLFALSGDRLETVAEHAVDDHATRACDFEQHTCRTRRFRLGDDTASAVKCLCRRRRRAR